jgi:hypothetical protein
LVMLTAIRRPTNWRAVRPPGKRRIDACLPLMPTGRSIPSLRADCQYAEIAQRAIRN